MNKLSVNSFDRSGDKYPFVAEIGDLELLIEDMHMTSFAEPAQAMWLTWIAGLGSAAADSGVPTPVHTVDLLLQDDTGLLVFDTRDFDEFSLELYSGTRHVVTWSREDTVISAVVNIDPANKAGYRTTTGLIDPRVTDWRPMPVMDIKIVNGTKIESAVRSDGSIKLTEGYNTNLTATNIISDRGENIGDINFDFVGGAGLGRHPGCDVGIGLRSIGGAEPDAQGDLLISGDDCIHFTPKLNFFSDEATVEVGEFVIRDGCTAHCECEDFTDLFKYVQRLYRQFHTLGDRAEKIRDLYHSIREYLIGVKECAETQILRVFTWPTRGCSFSASVGVCNPTSEPMRDVQIDFEIQDAQGTKLTTADAYCNSILRNDFANGQHMPTPYYFDAPLPDGRVTLRCIPPNSMGFVTFQTSVTGNPGDSFQVCARLNSAANIDPDLISRVDPMCTEVQLECPPEENCYRGSTTQGPTTQGP